MQLTNKKNLSVRTFVLSLCVLALLASCKEKVKVKKIIKSYTVTKQHNSDELYFSGTIEPIHIEAVVVPADATIVERHFNYGVYVQKGTSLATVNSPQLQRDYDDSLTSYLKAKDELEIAKAKFAGTQKMWDVGLVPRNTYKSEKSALYTNEISYMQSKNKLIEMLSHSEKVSMKDFENLQLTDFRKVRQALGKHLNLIPLISPATGIALKPSSDSDSAVTDIKVGSQVKQGDVMVLIGDMKGLAIDIKVAEINIDKIRPGMKATVTGVAFPDDELEAEVKTVNAQAISESGSSGGLPMFQATIEVPEITAEQRKLIKVGMSAKVSVAVSYKDSLTTPIKSIFQHKGKTYVHVRLGNGKVVRREIVTGAPTDDMVIVESGLKEGDVVVWKELPPKPEDDSHNFEESGE